MSLIMHQQRLQGWDAYSLTLRSPRPYINDLQHTKRQLKSRAPLVFVNDPEKIALENLCQSDNGDSQLPSQQRNWTDAG